jgi:hypothetical protein
MSEQLENDLRATLAACAGELPADASMRLRRLDYRPRSGVGRRLGVLGGAGLAAGAAAALTLAGVGAGTPRAFAGWSPAPTTPTSGQTAAAEAACSSRLPTSAELEHAQQSATGGRGAPEPAVPTILPGGWHAVIVDTRGPFTDLLYEAAGGDAQASCFSGPAPSQTGIGMGYGASPPTVAEGQIAVTSFGGGLEPPAPGEPAADQNQQYEDMVGRAGAGVSAIALTLSDGGHVEATVANGWFLAWWPGVRRAVSAEVRTASASRTQPLELPGVPGSAEAETAARRGDHARRGAHAGSPRVRCGGLLAAALGVECTRGGKGASR